MTPQDKFDVDYRVIRHLVVEGRMTLQDAKDWLGYRAALLQVELSDVRQKFRNMVWENRIDRQLDEIHKEEKCDRIQDEKDGVKIDEEED